MLGTSFFPGREISSTGSFDPVSWLLILLVFYSLSMSSQHHVRPSEGPPPLQTQLKTSYHPFSLLTLFRLPPHLLRSTNFLGQIRELFRQLAGDTRSTTPRVSQILSPPTKDTGTSNIRSPTSLSTVWPSTSSLTSFPSYLVIEPVPRTQIFFVCGWVRSSSFFLDGGFSSISGTLGRSSGVPGGSVRRGFQWWQDWRPRGVTQNDKNLKCIYFSKSQMRKFGTRNETEHRHSNRCTNLYDQK